MTSDKELLVERSGDGVVVITLNRPGKKNAISEAGWVALREAFESVARRTDDRVVVLTGAGGNFCSGADLSTAPTLSARDGIRAVNDACLAVRNLPKPTIAAVSGVAVGAGFNLALACDLAIIEDTARFSEIFSKRGLSVDFGGTWQLTHNLGLQRAKELAFFGRMYTANEMFERGLFNRIVDTGASISLAREWAAELLTIAPTALGLTKEMLNSASTASFEDALFREGIAQNFNVTTADTREAIEAFIQKRPPVFD
jgi:2-(1,2-epoxy-1,2-dihydrophenyl)acetyl-CoA isomerase